jgi:[ribosomal protein S18]-alanine N-acetyltransferase
VSRFSIARCIDEVLGTKTVSQQMSAISHSLNSGVEVRNIDPSDVEEVMRIEKTSFASPWSSRFFLEELHASCARCLLASLQDRTVGYVLYWRLPGEVDIHNLAVDRDYRRRGIGRCLMNAVINEAKQQGMTRVTLEVRRSNEAAKGLYHALGFAVQGMRTGYYSDNGEDAYVMALDLQRAV